MSSAHANNKQQEAGLSDQERQELVQGINNMVSDKEKVRGLTAIIQNSPTYTGDKRRISINVDALDAATQKQIQAFVFDERH